MKLTSYIGGQSCDSLTLHNHGPVPYSDAHISFLSFIYLPVPDLQHDPLFLLLMFTYWFFLLFCFGNIVFLTQDLMSRMSSEHKNEGARSKQEELLLSEYFLLKRCFQIVRCIKKIVFNVFFSLNCRSFCASEG